MCVCVCVCVCRGAQTSECVCVCAFVCECARACVHPSVRTFVRAFVCLRSRLIGYTGSTLRRQLMSVVDKPNERATSHKATCFRSLSALTRSVTSRPLTSTEFYRSPNTKGLALRPKGHHCQMLNHWDRPGPYVREGQEASEPVS